jgi:class 3 adenylate cyclase/tetratricopeptide (TPR) repeat protein
MSRGGPPAAGDERKLVTVLFADLVGSTELATRHDPERLRALLTAFFEEMSRQITAFGGSVEKYAGDAVMAVFGVPNVQEDDAERAVRAALAMRESLAHLNPMFEQEYGATLELRVGIATGEAVAATSASRELMVTGEVANLAARLQSAASGIVLSEETYRLVAPLLEVEPLPAQPLKGFPVAVRSFLVRRLVSLEARPRGIPGLSSPIVGRDRELQTLRRCADELRAGRGQVVSITGEAGIGKSRLKVELRDHLPEGVHWLEGRCHAYTQSTSYAPVIQLLRGLLKVQGGEPPAIARAKLRAGLIALVAERADQVQPAVADLLGVEIGSGHRVDMPVDPRTRHGQLVTALRVLLEAALGRSALVLTLEDLHWADPASIETITVLTELTDFLPLMILVTSRPDPEGGSWDFRFHAQRNYSHRLTELTLPPLAAGEAEQLVGNLLHVSDLPDDLRRRVLEQAEGNPFFVEELLRTLIESRVLVREGDRWVATAGAGHVVMPSTLRGVIAARIDRLPAPAKTALQRASVIGRFFTQRALRALHEDDAGLDRALAQLLRGELIREWVRPPEREYVFKHALTQDAAYAGLLAEDRKAWHERVAEHLEATGVAAAEENAALLAHHWLAAEDWEKSLGYSLQAAERARKLYARPDAIKHYWQSLRLLDRLVPSFERRRSRVDVALALFRLPGFARTAAEWEESFRHLEVALATAEDLGDVASWARLAARLGMFKQDEPLLRRSVERARAAGHVDAEALARWEYGEFLGQHGQYEQALPLIEEAIGLFEAAGAQYDHTWIMAMSGRCHFSRAGRMEQALSYALRARTTTEASGDLRLRAWCGMEAEPYMYQGRWEDVVRVGEEGLQAAWEILELTPIYFVSAWTGLAYLKLGRLEDARRVVHRAVREAVARTGPPFQRTYLQIALAQLRLQAGDPAAALAAARTALELADQSRFRLEQGAARRVLGTALAAAGHRGDADRELRSSREILDKIQSRPELAQTLLAYGRFRLANDVAGGRAMIERGLRLFEDMGATGWIDEARTVLGA